MSDLAYAMRMLSAPLPCVVDQCRIKGAKWYGKWCLSGAIPVGIERGPYDSEAAACAAVESAGWNRRPFDVRQSGPHFDRPQ